MLQDSASISVTSHTLSWTQAPSEWHSAPLSFGEHNSHVRSEMHRGVARGARDVIIPVWGKSFDSRSQQSFKVEQVRKGGDAEGAVKHSEFGLSKRWTFPKDDHHGRLYHLVQSQWVKRVLVSLLPLGLPGASRAL